MPKDDPEALACNPRPLAAQGFNPKAVIPYGCTVEHLRQAMQDFLDFLGFINTQLYTKQIPRLESFLMPANFSSMVGEFIIAAIPKYCPTLAKNTYHNGHPDLLPKGAFANDSMLHADKGIEIKGSRYMKAWQGHNAEACFLTVVVFDSSRPTDVANHVAPVPFSFVKVVGAQLTKEDWKFSGRSETSRRTITASVTDAGCAKMEANWMYRDPDLSD
jgi:hypothetical protein